MPIRVTENRLARCTRCVEPDVERPLVARLKAGELAAFEAVYQAYRPRLFTFLARLSRRRDVAEDLLDETWLRLVSSASRLADDTRLAPWLFTVARNLYASWCRHRALDDARIVDPPASWPAPVAGESPFDAAARNETERRLERALARLTVGDRETLLMVAGGLSPAEAAEALGLAPDTLRKRLQRARDRLAAAMKQEERSRTRLRPSKAQPPTFGSGTSGVGADPPVGA